MRTAKAYDGLLALLVAAASGVFAGDAAKPPAFTKKPAVAKAGEKYTITFAVDRETDVAMSIEDANGKVVRHLVAGLLGKNPPEPLKANTLEQSIEFDGMNDLGKPAGSGPFKARVGLGLKAGFDRMIGFTPGALPASVRAIAVGPKGEAFVFYSFGTIHPSDNSIACSVYSREGKYLRTIMPYPANVPEEKLKGVKRIEVDGTKVPFIYQAETRSFIPGAGENENHDALATSDGRVAFVGRMEYTRYAQAGPIHLLVINADGSVPTDGPVKTKIFSGGVSATLAMSPDEKTLYASDVRTAKDHYGKPVNVIYRFTWEDKEATPFLGGKEAKGDLALNDPKGICSDKDGNLFVADKGNDRVAVFKPDGSLLGVLKTPKPERVAVSRKTGALYVLGGPGIADVLKFKSWKDAEPITRTTIPTFKHDGHRVSMALDDSAEPTVLWFGSHDGGYTKFALLRIEDKGSAFGDKVDVNALPENKGDSVGALRELSLDREHEQLYVGFGARYDGRTGKNDAIRPILPPNVGALGAVLAAGMDGFLYVHHIGGVSRFSPDLKQAAFGGAGLMTILNDGSLRLHARGVTADAHGNVYLLYQKPVLTQFNALAMFGPDGTVKNEKLIDADIRSLNSVRTDYRGNVYLALGLRPGKDPLPEGLKGKLPDGSKDPDAVCGVNYYPYMYGSIAKFGPEGGLIQKGSGGTECSYSQGATTEVKGAKWIASGVSCVPSWRAPNFAPDICQCESPRFDVDSFGRSFYPDACRFRVGVLDTNGNELCTFGSYGNQDSAGPTSAVPVPAIPFCWVQAVTVGDEAAYIGDRLNRRIVRVKLEYSESAVVELR
ncbi:MAG: SMP-30/gluconolactonase/LRE family protein [Planctomycetes bacterium]|nr:SMP-30/gluconolactonase/LRE family protein [Planctomycetota bacterium]